ncbi:MAG: cytochrome C oxidase subunit IV [Kocuria rhizophila]|nr:MAG: cytochrome C oxidase subunit IV [Kocuria rhizophila]
MKVTANIFWIIGLFFIAAGLLYGFWSEWTEWAGIPAILAVGAMSWMIAWYLRATDKKFGLGPSDDEDGEITDYAGTYGTFAPWSWWPLGLGLACAIIVTGAYFTFGWVYEFSRGKYAH